MAPRAVAEALRVQMTGAPAEDAKHVRIDVHKLDGLVDTVGEMVIAQTLVCNDPGVAAIEDQRFFRNMAQLGRVTSELQKIAMSMRMVPVRSTFQKMSRLVRDLARKSGKSVVLVSEGEDTEIDRNMVEEIHDPLVHLIRNSVDHGIEPDQVEDETLVDLIEVDDIRVVLLAPVLRSIRPLQRQARHRLRCLRPLRCLLKYRSHSLLVPLLNKPSQLLAVVVHRSELGFPGSIVPGFWPDICVIYC